ncbi:MAG: STAS domain-containing protein [Terriglobales bacterium]
MDRLLGNQSGAWDDLAGGEESCGKVGVGNDVSWSGSGHWFGPEARLGCLGCLLGLGWARLQKSGGSLNLSAHSNIRPCRCQRSAAAGDKLFRVDPITGGSREASLDINVRKHADVFVIQLKGDLKIGDAVDALRQSVDDLLGGGDARLVLNITQVPMIDSSGIGILVRTLTSAKQRGGSVKLVNPSKLAMQTLKIVGLLNLFEVFDDEAKAVASYS